MASSSSAVAVADTLIGIKVQFNDATSRFKLPLRDLGSNVFEDKVRLGLIVCTPNNR
jgi:next to BRCA1 gene 1 protein